MINRVGVWIVKIMKNALLNRLEAKRSNSLEIAIIVMAMVCLVLWYCSH